ncbi:Dabb family protein [Paenibacillus sp. y28]|uniref:Dabb family protein n=1 Tax=Paenibacillus sp. y28 TaxID=3129110 RepID=UPI0030166D41
MIRHIVLFKLKDRSAASVQEAAQLLKDMEGKIPQLLSIEVGTDVIHSERSYDIALTTTFHSLDDLKAYNSHPVHQEVIKYMTEHRESSISVDYEV